MRIISFTEAIDLTGSAPILNTGFTINTVVGISTFVYYAYASDDEGTDFSLTRTQNLKWVNILITHTKIDNPVLSDFVGPWIKDVADSAYEDYLVYAEEPILTQDEWYHLLTSLVDVYNSEQTRVQNEITRQYNEEERINNEEYRVNNEQTRVSDEQIRQSDELTRQENENLRVSNEEGRVENEDIRISNEEVRVENEGDLTKGRVKAENDRIAAEEIRERVKGEMIELNSHPPMLINIDERLIWHYWDLTTHSYISSRLTGSLNWRGIYSESETYLPLDIISYHESTWVCIEESIGNLPTTTYFFPLVKGSYQYWIEAGNIGSVEDYLLWLDSKEPKLPDAPENPETKFLNGNKQWTPIAIGAGGYAAPLYFTTLDSDVTGYKKISYIAESTITELSATVKASEGDKLLRTYLFDNPIQTTVIDAGPWVSAFKVKVSNATGETRLKIQVFLRHANGSETNLFSAYSEELNNTSYAVIRNQSPQGVFSCLGTDRLGCRVFANTTHNAAITVTTSVGDGDASYITTPLSIRHTQLRDLNGDSNYLHITSAEKAYFEAKIDSTEKGAINGVAELDSTGKHKINQYQDIILGQLKFGGVFDADGIITSDITSLNGLDIDSLSASNYKGYYFISLATSTHHSIEFEAGDWLISNGTAGWTKIDNTDAVTLVNGKKGAVVLTPSDIGSAYSFEAICNTPAATVAKTATIEGLTSMVKGFYILKLTQGNTANAPTVNFGFGAYPIYLAGAALNTTAGNTAANGYFVLYFDGTYMQLVGSQRTVDSDTFDMMMWNNTNIIAGTIINPLKIIMQGQDGRYYPLTLEEGMGATKTVSTVEFPINPQILWYIGGSTLQENAQTTTTLSEVSQGSIFRYTSNQYSFTAYKNIYLKGTITAAGNFKLDNTTYTSWLTQDLPTTEDGFVYIKLGYMYSTIGMRLTSDHPIYQFKNGVLQPYAPTAVQTIAINIVDNQTVLATGDAQKIFTVPLELNGKELLSVAGAVDTVSTSGLPTFQMRDIALAADMLSTALTIDANEYNSYTALTAAVINPTYKTLYTGQRIAFDCDVAGTGTKGYTIYLKVK